MKPWFLCGLLGVVALFVPCNAWAAPVSAGDAATAGLGLAMILAIVLGAFLIGFFIQAIFIHIAASLMGLRGTFGAAFKASIIAWVLGLLFGVLGTVLSNFVTPTLAGGLNTAAWLLAGTLAIKSAYETGFISALVTYFLSLVVTIAILVALWFFFFAALVAGTKTV
ncbi:MAG: hypothetical protein HY291_02400 [Planctomycetes bacterium]|nr:hypothetical protein [Planctomycetota bacterium]